MYLYLATDLAPAHGERLGPDEDERLLLERMPVARRRWRPSSAARSSTRSRSSGLFWVERLRRASRA